MTGKNILDSYEKIYKFHTGKMCKCYKCGKIVEQITGVPCFRLVCHECDVFMFEDHPKKEIV